MVSSWRRSKVETSKTTACYSTSFHSWRVRKLTDLLSAFIFYFHLFRAEVARPNVRDVRNVLKRFDNDASKIAKEYKKLKKKVHA